VQVAQDFLRHLHSIKKFFYAKKSLSIKSNQKPKKVLGLQKSKKQTKRSNK